MAPLLAEPYPVTSPPVDLSGGEEFGLNKGPVNLSPDDIAVIKMWREEAETEGLEALEAFDAAFAAELAVGGLIGALEIEEALQKGATEDLEATRKALAKSREILPAPKRKLNLRGEIPGREFVRDWDPITIDSVEFAATEYLRPRGSKSVVYLTRAGDEELLRHDPESPAVSQVSYMATAQGGVKFLGMYLADQLRGRQAGSAVFNHFLKGIEKKGSHFEGTGQINKPLLAKLLAAEGLVPASTDFKAFILPRNPDIPYVPEICFVRIGDPSRMVREGSHREFYREVSAAEVIERGIKIDAGNLVTMHTSWVPAERRARL